MPREKDVSETPQSMPPISNGRAAVDAYLEALEQDEAARVVARMEALQRLVGHPRVVVAGALLDGERFGRPDPSIYDPFVIFSFALDVEDLAAILRRGTAAGSHSFAVNHSFDDVQYAIFDTLLKRLDRYNATVPPSSRVDPEAMWRARSALDPRDIAAPEWREKDKHLLALVAAVREQDLAAPPYAQTVSALLDVAEPFVVPNPMTPLREIELHILDAFDAGAASLDASALVSLMLAEEFRRARVGGPDLIGDGLEMASVEQVQVLAERTQQRFLGLTDKSVMLLYLQDICRSQQRDDLRDALQTVLLWQAHDCWQRQRDITAMMAEIVPPTLGQMGEESGSQTGQGVRDDNRLHLIPDQTIIDAAWRRALESALTNAGHPLSASLWGSAVHDPVVRAVADAVAQVIVRDGAVLLRDTMTVSQIVEDAQKTFFVAPLAEIKARLGGGSDQAEAVYAHLTMQQILGHLMQDFSKSLPFMFTYAPTFEKTMRVVPDAVTLKKTMRQAVADDMTMSVAALFEGRRSDIEPMVRATAKQRQDWTSLTIAGLADEVATQYPELQRVRTYQPISPPSPNQAPSLPQVQRSRR